MPLSDFIQNKADRELQWVSAWQLPHRALTPHLHTGVPEGDFEQSQVLTQGRGGIDQLELDRRVLCHDAEQPQI